MILVVWTAVPLTARLPGCRLMWTILTTIIVIIIIIIMLSIIIMIIIIISHIIVCGKDRVCLFFHLAACHSKTLRLRVVSPPQNGKNSMIFAIGGGGSRQPLGFFKYFFV